MLPAILQHGWPKSRSPDLELQADERYDIYSVTSDAALSYAHIVGKCVGVNGLLGFCAKAKRLWRTLTPSQAAPHDLPLSPIYFQSTPSDNFSSASEQNARFLWPHEGCVCRGSIAFACF